MRHLLFTAKTFSSVTPEGHPDRNGIRHIVQPVALPNLMVDHGLFLTRHAVQRQLGAMPCELYLVRLIHRVSGRAFPGERLWTSSQLSQPATLRFLRVRNCEGCDVYCQPFAGDQNAGYVLVDLDAVRPAVLESMRHNGHEPCVVLESSPWHWQVWIRVSAVPLPPAVATAIGRYLARTYGGDPASADWRHLGRLAGFTNQKPARRLPNGYAPWVRLRHAAPGRASQSGALLEQGQHAVSLIPTIPSGGPPPVQMPVSPAPTASRLYQACLHRLHIPQRFPQPDWSIADKWVARELLRQGLTPTRVAAILQDGSPGFPRRHSNPTDYLRRTIARAYRDLAGVRFPAQQAPCVSTHDGLRESGGTGATSS